ncbi:MAG TPA: hypothetical protein VLE53_13435 [Gemmatimonadaceae bacterium]|nr:hypothetical protein [Gemmatimonadaceae bacterium]
MACGGSDSPSGPETKAPVENPCASPSPPRSCPVLGAIADNHADAPHEARLERPVLDAGEALVLDIRGLGRHSHTLSLTSDQVMQIGAGMRVVQESSKDTHSTGLELHSHVVTFN